MKKTIISIFTVAAVVGGIYYVVNKNKISNQEIVTLREAIDDINQNKIGGCPREVSFGDWGCTVTRADCSTQDGSLMLSSARQKCGLPNNGQDSLTEAQFECAINACSSSAMQVDQNEQKLDKNAQ